MDAVVRHALDFIRQGGDAGCDGSHDKYQDGAQQTMISRKTWAAGILVCLLAVAAYGLYWREMAARLEVGINEWAESQRMMGTVAAFAWSGISGFPFAFRADFHSARFEIPVAPGQFLRWSGPIVSAQMRPWNLHRVKVVGSGGHELHLGSRGAGQSYRALAESFDGQVTLHSGGGIAEIRIGMTPIKVLHESIGPMEAMTATLGLRVPRNVPRDYQEPLIGISAIADKLVLPAELALPEGNRVDHAGIDAEIMGPIRPGTIAGSLAAWRDAGGTLEIRHAAYRQGTLDLQGDATLALDGALQPIGAGKIEAQGLATAIGKLSELGLVERGTANLAIAAVKALEVRNNSGALTATLPLSLQSGLLRLGPVPLARVPEIDWGQALP